MRFKHLLSEQQLDEIRMSPSALKKFAASDEAEGIRAGFEAELVFTGLGTDDDQEWEPDYDADERAYSIQQVIEFFENDEWGYGMNDRERRRLENDLDETYMNWYDERMTEDFQNDAEDLIREKLLDETPMAERLHAYLTDGDGNDGLDLTDEQADRIIALGEKAPRFTKSADQEEYIEANPDYRIYLDAADAVDALLDEEVEESIRSRDEYYDSALDDFRDSYSPDSDSFFSDVGLRWMSDIANNFDLTWPVMTVTGSGEGSFDFSNAQNLAADLEEVLGVKTRVSGGYHSAERDEETWIFEPDSSLDSDDSENMPVEIVSPPMHLAECLTKMAQFFEWAESNGAYANSSTGFHMGVSLPYTGGSVDYLKLALFLGDEYVLREFDRTANRFCEAAIKKIRQRVSGKDVSGAMELMRYNLLELAQKSLEINNHGFGKYTSINPQGGVDSTRPEKERPAKYIEFRSAGGVNYFEDIEKLQNTLMRYARAMSIAANPSAERREYYTKLYKLLTPAREATGGVELFAEFATGKISKEELKRRWAESALAKDAPELTQPGDWVVIDRNTGKKVVGQEYNNFVKSEVEHRAKQKISPGSSETDFDLNYEVVPMFTGRWEIYAFDPDFDDEEQTLEIVDADSRGQAVDQVFDKYNAERIPFKVRPYYGDYAKNKPPEPKLTPRAQLAKRIKQPPRQLDYNYEIVNLADYRLPVVDKFYAEEPRTAQAIFTRWLEIKNLPADSENYGYRPIEIKATAGEPQPASNVAQTSGPRNSQLERNDWELYQHDDPSRVVHRMSNATSLEVREFIDQQEREGMPPGFLHARKVQSATTETVDPVSGAGAVAPKQAPQNKQNTQQVQPVTPAAKVNIKNQPPDPYAQTYKRIKEWEDIVESMITPVGRLGQ